MITYFAIIMKFTYCFKVDPLRLHEFSAPPGSSPAGEVIQTIKQDCETIAELKGFDSWEEACKVATDKRVWKYQPFLTYSNGELTRMRCEPEPKFRLVEDK